MDVSLAAGEEAHISAAAANGGGGDDVTEIRMLLREGTAEVAGVPMSSEWVRFTLTRGGGGSAAGSDPNRGATYLAGGISVYTLEGAVISVVSNNRTTGPEASLPFHVHRAASRVPALFDVVRKLRKKCQLSPAGLRVLVIGRDHGVGCTYAARTLSNLCLRDEYGSAAASKIVYLDANVAKAAVSCVGTIACAEVTAELCSIDHPFVASPPIAFFAGAGAATSSTSASILAALGQAADAAAWIARRTEHKLCYTVIDTPTLYDDAAAPLAAVSPSSLHVTSRLAFHRAIVDIVAPTDIIFVGCANTQGGSDGSMDGLLAEISRTHRNVNVEFVPQLGASSRPTATGNAAHLPSVHLRAQDYFFGPPSCPLGCAKVIAPLSQLVFIDVDYAVNPPAVNVVKGSERGRARNDSDRGLPLPGTLCAVSLATTVAEVPFANIAGIVIVVLIDEASDEVTLVTPSGDATLPRQYLVLPREANFRARPDFETTI